MWAVVGLFIIVATVYDFYATTVTVRGSGPISKAISRGLWRGFLFVHHRNPNHKLLTVAGPLVLLLLILVWFVLCWFGWFLVFCGSEGAVINASTNQNASWWERIHYAGYTITTIGYGNFQAPNPPGQVASIIAGLNGLFLVTLAITYSIPVVSATVEKRKLALLIHTMGATTPDMLDNGHGRGDFAPLLSQTQQLSTLIAALAEKHYAYPVLHYFHGDLDRTSLPLNLVRLCEAISIVLFAFKKLPPDVRSQLYSSKRLINSFLEALESSFMSAAVVIPDPPDCTASQALSQSSRTLQEIEQHICTLSHRKLLLAYVRDDGWSWEDVHSREGR